MSLIYLPERRIRADFKPDFQVEIDWSHPLLQNCQAIFDGQNLYIRNMPVVPGVVQGISKTGKYGKVTSQYIAALDSSYIEALVYVTAASSASTYQPYCSYGYYIDSVTCQLLQFGEWGASPTNALNFRINGDNHVTYSESYPITEALYRMIGDHGTGLGNLYKNGALIASTSGTGANIIDTQKLLNFYACNFAYVFNAPTSVQQRNLLAVAPFRLPQGILRPKQRSLYLAVNNTGFITIGQPAETDAAQPITAAKYQAIGQTAETDTTQTITAVKTLAVGQVTETDTVQSITALKVAALAQVSESDIAQPLVFGLSASIGQASEAESALAVVVSKAASIGQASESDAAQALTFGLTAAIGQVAEADSTQSVAKAKALSTGIDSETDTPLAVSAVKTATLGQATEGESVASVAISKSVVLGQTTETGTAQPIVASIVLGVVTETEFVQAIAHYKTLGVLQVVETESAHAVTPLHAITIGQANESGSVANLGLVGGAINNTASLTDATVYAGLTDATVYAGLNRTRNY